MARLTVVLFVAIQATIPIPTGNLSVTSSSKEVGVIFWHGCGMAFLTGLFPVTHEALVLIEGSQFPMRTGPFRSLVRLGFGLAVAGVAIILDVTVEAEIFLTAQEILTVRLQETWPHMTAGGLRATHLGVTELAIVGVTTQRLHSREEGFMVAAIVIGRRHAGGHLSMALGTLLGVLGKGTVIEMEIIRVFRNMNDFNLFKSTCRNIRGIEDMAQHAILARVVNVDVMTSRTGVVIGERRTAVRFDFMAILARDPFLFDVEMVVLFQEPRSVWADSNFSSTRAGTRASECRGADAGTRDLGHGTIVVRPWNPVTSG